MRPLKKKKKKSKRTHGIASKRNAPRWKRGQSCTSNPTFKGHRDRVGQGYTKGNSGLTEAAVAKLNAANSSRMDVTDNDSASIGKSTFRTFVTNFTECTNTTFGNVYRLRANGDAVSKEVRCSVFSTIYVNIGPHFGGNVDDDGWTIGGFGDMIGEGDAFGGDAGNNGSADNGDNEDDDDDDDDSSGDEDDDDEDEEEEDEEEEESDSDNSILILDSGDEYLASEAESYSNDVVSESEAEMSDG